MRDWEPRGALVDEGRPSGSPPRRASVLDGLARARGARGARAATSPARSTALGYADATISLDLAGRERIVEARWRRDADRVIAALRAGRPVLLPTDTVYGLVLDAGTSAEVDAALRAQGPASREQPTALIAASVDAAARLRPRARRAAADRARRCCPARTRSCCRTRRAASAGWPARDRTRSASACPSLPPEARRVLEAVGCVAATSANEPGGPDPRALDDVPARIRAGCAPRSTPGRCPGRRRP